MATVLSAASRALLSACVALGLDDAALLGAAGLRRDQVANPDERIQASSADALWTAAFRANGDPGLAWRAVLALRGDEFRVLHHIAACSATFGDALRAVVRWLPLVDPRLYLKLEEQRTTVSLTLAQTRNPVPLPRAPTEFTLGAIVAGLRRSVAPDWAPVKATFPFPRPSDLDHGVFLRCPVSYGAPRAALLVDQASLSRRLAGNNPSLRALLEDYAGRIGAAIDDRADHPLSRLHDVIRPRLSSGGPALSEAARALGMGDRSLQRWLAEHDTSFRAAVAAVQEQQAKAYLCDPGLGIAEIASLVGFADQRAFTRAFGRWTGTTPGAWRVAAPTNR